MSWCDMRGWASAVLILAICGGVAAAQNVRPDPEKTKSSNELREVFRTVTRQANASTVLVRATNASGKERQVAFGTVVDAAGFVLTKASEVEGRSGLAVRVAGKDVPAKVVGVSEPTDLAMLKVDGVAKAKWAAVEWADLKKDDVVVGEWVATAGPPALLGEKPVAVGVVSVGRRKIPGRSGFLGVAMGDATGHSGARIMQVIPGSAAEKAGLKVDDVITAVNGRPVRAGVELAVAVRQYRPGDVVSLAVMHAKDGKMTMVDATLGTDIIEGPSQFMMKVLSGEVSKRASDFAAVFQHDTVIRPVDCGGPLVDLSGKVIGINIARAGRTETYALPADLVQPLIGPLESGKLAPVNEKAPAKVKAGQE